MQTWFVFMIHSHKSSVGTRCLNCLSFGISATNGKSTGIKYKTHALKPSFIFIWRDFHFFNCILNTGFRTHLLLGTSASYFGVSSNYSVFSLLVPTNPVPRHCSFCAWAPSPGCRFQRQHGVEMLGSEML